MSLDRIDQYIMELRAIREYPVILNELLARTKECLALEKLREEEKEAWKNEKFELELELEIAKEKIDELERKYDSKQLQN